MSRTRTLDREHALTRPTVPPNELAQSQGPKMLQGATGHLDAADDIGGVEVGRKGF